MILPPKAKTCDFKKKRKCKKKKKFVNLELFIIVVIPGQEFKLNFYLIK